MSYFVRTHKRRKKFLDELALGQSVSAAARAAGGTPSNFRSWRRSDPDFDRDCEDAIEEGTDFLEDVATERALKKSDPLMMMMLKARRPEKYDRNSGKNGVEVNINVEGSKAKLLNKLARLKAAREVSALGSEGESEVSSEEDEAEQEPTKLLPDHSRKPDGRRKGGDPDGHRGQTAT